MATIATLREEHQIVSEKMLLLEKALSSPESPDSQPILAEVVNLFKKGLPLHFAIEEQAVFPLVERFPGGSQLAIDLKNEHPILLGLFQEFIDAVKAKRFDDRFQKAARSIMAMLPAHAKREDKELLPLLKQLDPSGNLELIQQHAPPVAYPQEGGEVNQERGEP